MLSWRRLLSFGRRKTRPSSPARVRHDWRAGDLVICVADRWHEDLPENPRRNQLLVVSGLHCAFGFCWLSFEKRDPKFGWDSRGFRKVTPDHTPAERQFAEQLKALHPAAPAKCVEAGQDD